MNRALFVVGLAVALVACSSSSSTSSSSSSSGSSGTSSSSGGSSGSSGSSGSTSSSGSSGVTCNNCACCSYLDNGARKHMLCASASDVSAACNMPTSPPSGCIGPQDGDCP